MSDQRQTAKVNCHDRKSLGRHLSGRTRLKMDHRHWPYERNP